MKHCLALCAIALAGCASQYHPQPTADSATLKIIGNNAHFFTEAYENEDCVPHKDGIRLATFTGMTKDVENPSVGKTVQIPAGKPFVLSHYYIDARVAQNRICRVTVAFVPERGQSYQTYFHVEPDVSSCDTLVSASTGSLSMNVPSFKYGRNLCVSGENHGPVARKATRLDWKVNLQRAPAR
ncbi:hypothetical protein GmRootA79_09820 [Acidovorax sp. A79]|uniref:hypothetical protein n=1 Tax=Acidovorax sp. A79 TaxID=3056107 RepID=UPI0034E8BCC3